MLLILIPIIAVIVLIIVTVILVVLLRKKGKNKEEQDKEKVKEELLEEMEKELDRDIVLESGMSSPEMDLNVSSEEFQESSYIPFPDGTKDMVFQSDLDPSRDTVFEE
ncbi:MAG: hypothetical protein JW939_09185 [Candidatus Thermoplasmatota archaeon]|nr:hypothetical protein [Candidatus Thermoplasmatota archaeon]